MFSIKTIDKNVDSGLNLNNLNNSLPADQNVDLLDSINDEVKMTELDEDSLCQHVDLHDSIQDEVKITEVNEDSLYDEDEELLLDDDLNSFDNYEDFEEYAVDDTDDVMVDEARITEDDFHNMDQSHLCLLAYVAGNYFNIFIVKFRSLTKNI